MAKEKFREIGYSEKGLLWETYPELCKSCGICIAKCPVGAISYDEKNNEYLGMPAVKCNTKKCIFCRTCESVCPECAIKVTGKK